MGLLAGNTLEFISLKEKGDSFSGVLTQPPDVHDYHEYDPATKKKRPEPKLTRKGNVRQEITLTLAGDSPGTEKVFSFLQYGDFATKLDEAADQAGIVELEDYVGRTVTGKRLTPRVPGSMATVEFEVTVV